MQQLGYGRLGPWKSEIHLANSSFKKPIERLLEFVRSVEAGEIRVLEIRRGLPLTMEIANNRVR